jgi:hypothetical protein
VHVELVVTKGRGVAVSPLLVLIVPIGQTVTELLMAAGVDGRAAEGAVFPPPTCTVAPFISSGDLVMMLITPSNALNP